jgi:hypothetical protein
MNNQAVTVNRSLVGIIAVVLLAGWGVMSLFESEGSLAMWAGACLKVGLVMAAFWLALPSLTRNSEFGQASWMSLIVAIGVALVVARTKVPLKIILPTLVAFVFVVRILGPRRNSQAPTHPKRNF